MKTISVKKTEDIARRIVREARRHFFLHGFRNVTMSDLAAEMGVSKKTLYVHFTSKQELVKTVVETKYAELSAALLEVHSGSTDFAATIHRLLVTIQKQAREVSPSFLRDLRRELPALFEFFRERRQKIMSDTFGKLLRQGQKEGAVRRDISVEFQVEVLLATVYRLATPEKIDEMKISLERLIHDILGIFLEGTLTKKGRSKL
ncbi:MAG: TetR/AcrR family transcriptional regulator [Chthoniobacterales bacterium]